MHVIIMYKIHYIKEEKKICMKHLNAWLIFCGEFH